MKLVFPKFSSSMPPLKYLSALKPSISPSAAFSFLVYEEEETSRSCYRCGSVSKSLQPWIHQELLEMLKTKQTSGEGIMSQQRSETFYRHLKIRKQETEEGIEND
ncbi:hypothetical protein Ancab_018826 [Ancistrocladus abbreviatus]